MRNPANNRIIATALCAVLIVGSAGCGSGADDVNLVNLVDPLATEETKALYANLQALAGKNLLFGHQDDLAYGVYWRREEGRSDVKDIAGSYPAVMGWELGNLEYPDRDANIDGVNFDDMQRWIKVGREAGGVITIGWHMDNPVSGGSSWDTTRAVYAILPGGEKHDLYRSWLDNFATFVEGLDQQPIIFRPFHEHTGSWFWWGGRHVTADEYVRLWRFTVEYLRDEKGLHNLIYAYATDVFDDEEHYLRFWPGDDYVDLMGYDDYHGVGSDSAISDMTNRLRMLVTLADERGKIAALTETGLEGVTDEDFWTNRLLKAITADPQSRRIVYALVWRNANNSTQPGHHYAPYKGHASEADFLRFYNDPYVMFADELPELYQ